MTYEKGKLRPAGSLTFEMMRKLRNKKEKTKYKTPTNFVILFYGIVLSLVLTLKGLFGNLPSFSDCYYEEDYKTAALILVIVNIVFLFLYCMYIYSTGKFSQFNLCLYMCLIIMVVGMRAVQFGSLLNLEEENY